MKIFFSFIFFINIIISILCQYDYIYEPEKVIEYINSENLDKNDFEYILYYIINIFKDAYAFNDIAKNPPQPTFNNNYFSIVDLEERLFEIKQKVLDDEITEVYDFYREIILIISKLKDSHIQINWNLLNLNDFYIISPIEFYIKNVDNKPRLFIRCLPDNFLNFFIDPDFSEYSSYICNNNGNEEQYPVKSINGGDPFDYINNFGGDFSSTKNEHSTFSFKLEYQNDIPLSYYPLSLDDFKEIKIEFELGDDFITKYFIGSDLENIDIERRNLNYKNINLENLENQTKIMNKTSKKKYYRNFIRNKKRRKLDYLPWKYYTYGEDEDKLKCYEDVDNKLNIFYIESFEPIDKDNFLKVMEECILELFDKNTYPIVLINHLNSGGYVYLSQILLGIISPLMSIDIYKGRIRITDSFKETEDIKYYIETNITNSENCLHTNFEQLNKNKVKVDYGNDIKSDLTELFFLNNITIHNRIENLRKNMNYKRKPTEILIFTDGYTFSAASLFMNYIQKSGGAIVASYMGNPSHMDDKPFDISQSPSPVFSHKLLKIFSKNYENLLNNGENEEWEIQIPGIQSFYDKKDNITPLEYEIIEPDEKSYIFSNYNDNSKDEFIIKSIKIFEKYKNECNPKNKNLLKISEECDSKFPNQYTHGGYECGDDGKWSKICVANHCDPGYIFDRTLKKCVKDFCSSIPVSIEEEEEERNNDSYSKKLFIKNILFFIFIFYL